MLEYFQLTDLYERPYPLNTINYLQLSSYLINITTDIYRIWQQRPSKSHNDASYVYGHMVFGKKCDLKVLIFVLQY